MLTYPGHKISTAFAVPFNLIDSTDNKSNKTGIAAVATAYLYKPGITAGVDVSARTFAEKTEGGVGAGVYTLAILTTDLAVKGWNWLKITAAGCNTQEIAIEIVDTPVDDLGSTLATIKGYLDTITTGLIARVTSIQADLETATTGLIAVIGTIKGYLDTASTGLIAVAGTIKGYLDTATTGLIAVIGNIAGVMPATTVAAKTDLPPDPDNASIGTTLTEVQNVTYGLSALQTLLAGLPDDTTIQSDCDAAITANAAIIALGLVVAGLPDDTSIQGDCDAAITANLTIIAIAAQLGLIEFDTSVPGHTYVKASAVLGGMTKSDVVDAITGIDISFLPILATSIYKMLIIEIQTRALPSDVEGPGV